MDLRSTLRRLPALATITAIVLVGCTDPEVEVGAGSQGSAPSADESAATPPGEAPRQPSEEDYRRMAEEGFPVGEGDVEARVTQEELDAQDERVAQRLLVPGTGVGDVPPEQRSVAPEVVEAYQVLEAIELHDADGTVVGYWGGYFIGVDDYPAARREAEAVAAAAG